VRLLIDYHHSDLFESHLLLFADRFGWEVWRPIGMEWFTEGYWQFEKEWHGDAVAKQYLDLWSSDGPTRRDGIWRREDATHPGRTLDMVTLDVARDMKWDVVISSVPDNDPGLLRFAKEVGATWGVHVGNEAQYSAFGSAAFALCSARMPYQLPCPSVEYRQPFDTEGIFYPEWPPAEQKSVASFIQCFAENKTAYAEFLAHARHIPDMDWKVYGAYGGHPEDEFACGNLEPVTAVAEAMRRTRIVWHSKEWSDGFGHIIHNAFAVGRPVVGRARYYQNKLAGDLWVEGVTSFDIDRRSDDEIAALLRRLRDDDDFHREVSEAGAARFREVVDWDTEAEAVRELIEAHV
jgi:hypothetical protein